MYGTHLSGGGELVIKIRALEFNAGLIFLLATIIDKDVAKTVTSFLTILDISLSSGFSCCSYNT